MDEKKIKMLEGMQEFNALAINILAGIMIACYWLWTKSDGWYFEELVIDLWVPAALAMTILGGITVNLQLYLMAERKKLNENKEE